MKKERHFNKQLRGINLNNACTKSCVEYVKETGFHSSSCTNPEHDPNWEIHVEGKCIAHKCKYCREES